MTRRPTALLVPLDGGAWDADARAELEDVARDDRSAAGRGRGGCRYAGRARLRACRPCAAAGRVPRPSQRLDARGDRGRRAPRRPRCASTRPCQLPRTRSPSLCAKLPRTLTLRMRRHMFIVLGLVVLVAASPGGLSRPGPTQADCRSTRVTGQRAEDHQPRAPQTLPDGQGRQGRRLAERRHADRRPPGLKVAAFAGGLDHPRWLYRLPNGDVLVAESNSPPRKAGGITGWVMGMLMKQRRRRRALGQPHHPAARRQWRRHGGDAQSPFMTGLNSPFGMALVGEPALRRQHRRAGPRARTTTGETKITAKPEKVIELPGGGNHWARNVIAAPDGKHACSSASARPPTSPRTASEREKIPRQRSSQV